MSTPAIFERPKRRFVISVLVGDVIVVQPERVFSQVAFRVST